ncbi:exo-alpha-sialidase [Paenibacillus koleovorans]|uniref:exo-alpha-sialidase n=1 Tax=Paenibacillus koleovorans TaxID=121608 RepID=UPI0013E313A4|nr:exo-alpha-sialidase [Paenibacillus koleovorans]
MCVLTTGGGHEGDGDQHIVATISQDQGKTWSEPIDIEPSGPPEASWVTPMIVPSGRVYAFYTYNSENLREIIADTEYARRRVDTLGDFAFKYSDDHGRTWSKERYIIPVRAFDIDNANPYQGRVRFFWSVSKPMVHKDSVYIGLSKVGGFGGGFMKTSEGAFVRSDNMLYETNASAIRWETLPEGTVGLRSPAGPIADEHNLVSLRDGSLYCTYRTVEGHNCHAYSRDDGRTWTPPEYAVYSPGGRRIKHPRAANFVRKFSNEKYLLWFHNHGRNLADNPSAAYEGRNPVWLAGGVEKDGYIHWSQPEILLYGDEPSERMSYPDFIETEGRYFVTETQKTIARVHEIDPTLLQGLWSQAELNTTSRAGLVLELGEEQCQAGEVRAALPAWPELKQNGGFSLEFWLRFDKLVIGQSLFDTRNEAGVGVFVHTTDRETVKISLCDGRTESSWESDKGRLAPNQLHHLVITVDEGAKIITFLIDGVLCDGGTERDYGFGRFSRDLRSVNGAPVAAIGSSLAGKLYSFRVYNRYLRTSESVGNYQAGYSGADTV